MSDRYPGSHKKAGRLPDPGTAVEVDTTEYVPVDEADQQPVQQPRHNAPAVAFASMPSAEDLKPAAPALVEISMDDLNLVGPMENGVEIELMNAGGHRLGVFVHVLGEYADSVRIFLEAMRDKRAVEAAEAEKAGQPWTGTVSHKDQIENAVVRCIGWRGLKEPFSVANARKLITLNPNIGAQIIAASRKESLFLSTLPKE